MKKIIYTGVDVSQYQNAMSVENLKNLDFVIIRAGYGKYMKQKDPMFENHYATAKAAGKHIGVYWYSYAMTVEDAELEADVFQCVIAGKEFDFPVYFDFEEPQQLKLPKEQKKAIIRAFCEKMEKSGYFCGVYTSRSAIQAIGEEIPRRFALWLAEWGVDSPNYPENLYGVWQYTDKGLLNNKSGFVDLNYAVIDYPELIKKNGLNNCPVEKPKATKAQQLYRKWLTLSEQEKKDFESLVKEG